MQTKETTRKQRPAIDRLPADATANDVWTRVVIPSFINLILSGDKPWASSEADVAPVLQNVWNHTYGSSVPYKIEKGTVALDLVCEFLIPGHILIFSSFRLFKSCANTGMGLQRKPSLQSIIIFYLKMLTTTPNLMNLWQPSQSLRNISSKKTISFTKALKIPKRQVEYNL